MIAAVRGTLHRWPFLDWSLVQPGYQHMPRSPKYGNVPYGIAIRSQPAHRSVPVAPCGQAVGRASARQIAVSHLRERHLPAVV